MKNWKVVEVTKTVLESVTCDFCSQDIPSTGFDVEDVTITYEEGYRFHYGGTIKETSFDCCHICWDRTIFPFLLNLAKPTITERDF